MGGLWLLIQSISQPEIRRLKMKHRNAGAISLAFFLTIAAFGSALAQDLQSSDFLSDYSQLKKTSDKFMGHSYLVPGAEDTMASYTAVIIDQPEIFIAPNSKYKGMKPDDMKALADAFRTSMSQALAQDFMIVEQAGPNVLYVRFALTNLQLKKKKRGLLSFTPVGLVAGAAKSALTSDITKKIDLKGLTIEMEVLDSSSQEQLAALLETRSGKKDEPASWAEVEALIAVYSQRMRCRLGNARVAEENRVDCLSDT
jgi:hypothetical protein